MYTNTSGELWIELENRYAQSNGPTEYRLMKELGALSQGFLTISAYFSKLKKLWDELGCISYTPKCTCGAAKENTDIKNHDQTIQFLMRLKEIYDHVRNQILMMEPIPAEEENTGQPYALQNMAMQVYKKLEFQKNFQKKRNFQDKRQQICKECGKSGYFKESCFEIHGYPDWYKTLMEQRKGNTFGSNNTAAAIDVKNAGNSAVDGKAITEMLRIGFPKILGSLKPKTLTITDEDRYNFSSKTEEHDSLNTENFDT
ncbi:UNVERIFIED_CONTAM: hypothetical protein Sindi_0967600 [Sesamum indicum]